MKWVIPRLNLMWISRGRDCMWCTSRRMLLHGLFFWRVRAVGRLWSRKGNAFTSGAEWQTQKFPLQETSIVWQARPHSANAFCFNFYPSHVFLSWNLETQVPFIRVFIFHFWTLLPMNYPSFSSCWRVELFELCSAALVQFYLSFISVKLNNY